MTGTDNKGNQLFPVFLKLDRLHTVVIGGGHVGLEKVTALVTNSPNAQVTVIAPEISQEIVDLSYRYEKLKIEYTHYAEGVLKTADLVVAAVNDRTLSEQIASDAARLNIPVNVADTPDLCDFYLGSVVKKGDLKIAISTNGKSPTIAKRLREYLEQNIPSEMDEVLENLHQIRNRLKGDFKHKVRVLNQLTKILTVDDEEVTKN